LSKFSGGRVEEDRSKQPRTKNIILSDK